MADAYATDNVLVTWGFDFGYYDAINTYGLIDDVVAFLNERVAGAIEFKFSTVKDYSTAVKKEFESKKIKL